MGYYTNYNLKIKENKSNLPDMIVEIMLLDALKKNQVIGYALDENFERCDSAKWYDHETELKEISIQIENVLFELHGEGEETMDQWYKYFENGKMQHCQAIVTYEPYDEQKLK